MAPFLKIAKYKAGKNLSMELYQLCILITFTLSHFDFFYDYFETELNEINEYFARAQKSASAGT